jgi:hypothetical protein
VVTVLGHATTVSAGEWISVGSLVATRNLSAVLLPLQRSKVATALGELIGHDEARLMDRMKNWQFR